MRAGHGVRTHARVCWRPDPDEYVYVARARCPCWQLAPGFQGSKPDTMHEHARNTLYREIKQRAHVVATCWGQKVKCYELVTKEYKVLFLWCM
jgi:hypothetical protein